MHSQCNVFPGWLVMSCHSDHLTILHYTPPVLAKPILHKKPLISIYTVWGVYLPYACLPMLNQVSMALSQGHWPARVPFLQNPEQAQHISYVSLFTACSRMFFFFVVAEFLIAVRAEVVDKMCYMSVNIVLIYMSVQSTRLARFLGKRFDPSDCFRAWNVCIGS